MTGVYGYYPRNIAFFERCALSKHTCKNTSALYF